MKNIIYVLLIVFLSTVFKATQYHAQNRIVDSLILVIKKSADDTNKVKCMGKLIYRIYETNPDTAIIIANQALELSVKLKFMSGIAMANSRLGICYLHKGDNPTSVKYHFKAMETWEEIETKYGKGNNKKLIKNISSELNAIGIGFQNMGNNDKALSYFLKGLAMDEKIGDKENMAAKYNNIADFYIYGHEKTKARDYYLRALKINEELNNKPWKAINLANLGALSESENDFEKALKYYFEALKINEEEQRKYNSAINLGNIGALYFKAKEYKKAEEFLLKSRAFSEEVGDVEGIRFTNDFLFKLHRSLGNYKLAIEYLILSQQAKDSISNKAKNEQLIRTEMSHEFQVKQTLLKAEQEKKDAITQQESIRQKMILAFVISVLVLVFVGAAFILRSLKTTRKQKLLIEEKNKEILDSIRYAKRIQQSLLPTEKYIDKKLKA